jgi:glycosyltransferase A (GT-A) superfamily protein (DUF2064 family)
MVENTINFANNIIDMEMADEQDDTVKAIFGKRLKRYHLGTYIDFDNIDNLKELARMEAKMKKGKPDAEA